MSLTFKKTQGNIETGTVAYQFDTIDQFGNVVGQANNKGTFIGKIVNGNQLSGTLKVPGHGTTPLNLTVNGGRTTGGWGTSGTTFDLSK